MSIRPLQIVGIGGSLGARPSTSLAALRRALEACENAGARTICYDIRELDLPFFRHEDPAPVPDRVHEYLETVHRADGLIWASPLYQGTISGAFKNAIDWLEMLSKLEPPYLHDKVVGLIGSAAGVQALQAINTMEYAVRALRGMTVPMVVTANRSWAAFEGDKLVDGKLDKALEQLGTEVVRKAKLLAAGRES
ncbi:MAG: NAD(P)H-dependent oxidoreductase [bacterium]|nr:NAD(P)H-dependent oxidoreductase [bacterium]